MLSYCLLREDCQNFHYIIIYYRLAGYSGFYFPITRLVSQILEPRFVIEQDISLLCFFVLFSCSLALYTRIGSRAGGPAHRLGGGSVGGQENIRVSPKGVNMRWERAISEMLVPTFRHFVERSSMLPSTSQAGGQWQWRISVEGPGNEAGRMRGTTMVSAGHSRDRDRGCVLLPRGGLLRSRLGRRYRLELTLRSGSIGQ